MSHFSPPGRECIVRVPAGRVPDVSELPDGLLETLSRSQRFADHLWLAPPLRGLIGGSTISTRRSKVLPRPVLTGGYPFSKNSRLLTYSWSISLDPSIIIIVFPRAPSSFPPPPLLFSVHCFHPFLPRV